jgi:hypothetical protein
MATVDGTTDVHVFLRADGTKQRFLIVPLTDRHVVVHASTPDP